MRYEDNIPITTRQKALLAGLLMSALLTACVHDGHHMRMRDGQPAESTAAAAPAVKAPPGVQPWEKDPPDSEY